VIRETNRTAGRIFPVVLDVEQPKFVKLMDQSVVSYLKIVNAPASSAPQFIQNLQRLPHILAIGWNMVQLYFIKPIHTDKLEGSVL
jgi:magnesium-protoporphyrin IX monomethyl ester (oxidative) cyclase